MRNNRLVLACLGFVTLGVIGLGLGVATGPASGQVKAPNAQKVTVINVTVGKPTELAFKLSKFSAIPAGSIVFNVKNVGLGFHNFKICTTPVATAAKNSCVGKATAILKNGQKATLTVVLTKSGKYEFLCSVPGHAAAGMKGLLGVGVNVAAPVVAVVTTSKTTTTASGSTSSGSTSSGSTSSGSTSSGGGGGGAAAGECPPGLTIVQGAASNSDHDPDDDGGPTDGDGCL